MKKAKSNNIRLASKAILHNFAMSPDLARAIGAVVVQALEENAKEGDTADSFGGGGDLDDDFGLDDMDDFDLDESELEESSRDAGEVQEAEGPKSAPDLSQDFAELKGTVKNLSDNTYLNRVKNFLDFAERMR